MNTPQLLDETSVAAYLRVRGIVAEGEAAVVEPLSGGFINNVFRVTAGGREYALKQALTESRRTVLHADIRRSIMEAQAMKVIKSSVGPDCPIPDVLYYDPANYVTVMTAAPRTAVLYQDELMAGRCHAAAAYQIGVYAGRLHRATTGKRSIARQFATNPGFELRDQSIRSAGTTHPDLQDALDTILTRDRQHATALVDYDITPKNVLIHDNNVTKLDFECVKYGDPAFDVGVALAHFLLVVFCAPRLRESLVGAARSLYLGYTEQLGAPPGPAFVRRVKDYIAAMMLGRSDGDLILDFLRPHRAAVNLVARRLLTTRLDDMEEVLQAVP